MTVQELYDSVSQLGFETALEDNNRFFLAANRAIIQVNRIKPATSIYKLNHFPLENLIEEKTYEPKQKDKEELIFACDDAKSYYFECNGDGTMIIEKNTDNGESWIAIGSVSLSSVDGRFIQYKGFVLDGGVSVLGRVRLRFSGEYVYYVQNVAMYGSLISTEVKDIPVYAEYAEYDIASLTNDFLSFACPPIVDAKRGEEFALNIDYFVEGVGKILIPASTKGVFEINYNRNIQQLDSENASAVIDLDEELCAILPNLIASYIWLDDEPEKAQYYLSLYREQVAEILQKKKNPQPFIYRNKSGW